MKDATYKLGKGRVYDCRCGAKPHRPLQAADTTHSPYPKPCDKCGADLNDRPFVIEDMGLFVRRLLDP